MNDENPRNHSFQYRVAALHGGKDVPQYDFARHGRDNAARLLPAEMRLSLELFSPEHQWQHEGLIKKQCYLDVRLGKLRMNYAQFETTARAVFEKLGIVGSVLQLERIHDGAVHKMRVKLPQQLLQDSTEAMDAAYWQASEAEKQRNNPSPSR